MGAYTWPLSNLNLNFNQIKFHQLCCWPACVNWQQITHITMCGPMFTMSCLLLSIWGLVQLTIMGVCFYCHCVSVFDDLGFDVKEDVEIKHQEDLSKFYEEVDHRYRRAAYNCWIAALVFFVLISCCSSKLHELSRSALKKWMKCKIL